jgi:hypothetical protein
MCTGKFAGVAELVDALDLGSNVYKTFGFKSHHRQIEVQIDQMHY